MAVSVFKTFSAGEVLTASDLNSSLTQITDNGEDLAWPATKAKDFNGQALTLDADGDTALVADSDDVLDLDMQGVASIFRWDGSVASVVNGLYFVASAAGNAVQIQAAGSDTNISINLVPKGNGSFQVGGSALSGVESDQAIIAQLVFSGA